MSSTCPHPCRRFFARMIDAGLYLAITLLFYHLVLHRSPLRYPGSHTLVFFLVYILFAILLESVYIRFRSSTIGKSFFGIKILSKDDSKLRLGQSLRRTASVWLCGLSLGVFPLSLITMLISYFKQKEGKELPFDADVCVEISAKEPIFSLVFISIIYFCNIFHLLFLSFNYTSVPNHGLLTPVRLAENYRHLQKYFYLEDKTWELSDNLVFYDDKPTGSIAPSDMSLAVTTENGIIRRISCSFSGDDPRFTVPHKEILLLFAASNGADGFEMRSYWENAQRRFAQPREISRSIHTFDKRYTELHYSFIADGYQHSAEKGRDVYWGGNSYSLSFEIYCDYRK